MKNLLKNNDYRVIGFIAYLWLSLFSQVIVAQINPEERIPGKRVEDKTGKSNYVIVEQGDVYRAYNKNNVLMLQETRWNEMRYVAPRESIKFNDRPIIDSLVKEMIAPYFRSYKPQIYSEDIVSFGIGLFSDIDGKVREVIYSFPKDSELPIEAIDCIENAIHKAGLRIVFNPNSFYFKGSKWVDVSVYTSIARMKQMLEENNR